MSLRKTYQRKHLRAPFRERVLYSDGKYLLRARAFNISEGGLLIEELPSFPESDELKIILSLPQIPMLKNFSLLKMKNFTKTLFPSKVVIASARMVRRQELSQQLDNIFKSKFGLEFVNLNPVDQKLIDEYVSTFSSNIIFLQMLIDSFNTDDETKNKVRFMANILGYLDIERIAELRAIVSQDYKSLQWL
jgi:hypothetical protein